MLVYKDGIVAHYNHMFKNTSFSDAGPNDEFLAAHNSYRVNAFLPHDRKTEKLVSTEPYIQDGWAYTVKVEPKTQEEINEYINAEAIKVRAKRNALLSDTDWVTSLAYDQNQPVPLEWQAYRQALRDVTLQDGFPFDVSWPTKPR